MNGKVHYWIVCDAVAYIKNYGTPLQKRALQSFELAYGQRRSIEDIPASQSAVERLAGFESWHTDKFGDLSLRVPALPWRTKRNVTGLFGHTFTAFNHFINPHPDGAKQWSTGSGYSYNSSSMKGFDAFVVKGLSVYLRGLVDEDNSLVLNRVRPAWTKGLSEWRDNFEHEIVNTTFAPWSVLVKFYYTYFLHDQNEPLEVRGPNAHLVGLQLLGPVFHAIADACSPQHVRPALGFGHQAWENYVQSRVYSRQIDVNPALISKIMAEGPFNPELTASEGKLKGRFDVETFVYQLSVKTAETVSRSTSSPWSELFKAGENFWKWYLTGRQMEDDTMYLYNQAVAGTVHAIMRAYNDLESLGVLTHNGLRSHANLPCLKCMQDNGIDMPTKTIDDRDAPPEETRPDPLRKASDILGFEPSSDSVVQKLIDEFEASFTKSGRHHRRGRQFAELLGKIETSIVQEYQLRDRQVNSQFCPLQFVERIPVDSDISAHFGVETFRLPSIAECKDSTLFSDYIDRLDEHSEVAHKLELTMSAASLTYFKTTCELPESRTRRVDGLIDTLHQDRDDTVAHKTARIVTKAIVEDGGGLVQKAVFVVQEFLASFSRIPAMAMATAVAVVLVLILVVPWGGKLPVMGLSGEAWDESGFPAPKAKGLKFMSPEVERAAPEVLEPRVATIIYFKDFPKPPKQEWINQLYAYLKPDQNLRKRFYFIPPRDIEQAVNKGEIKTAGRDQMLDGLRKILGVSRVLTINIISVSEGFRLESEFINLEDGQIKVRKSEKPFDDADIGTELRKTLNSLLSESAN